MPKKTESQKKWKKILKAKIAEKISTKSFILLKTKLK